MTISLTRRTLLVSAFGALVAESPMDGRAQSLGADNFLLTNPASDSATFLRNDATAFVGIAPSPWGASKAVGGRAYVSGAQAMTIVDIENQAAVETIPYRTPIESIGYGEYRSGGMGIAVTPDGSAVAVGIHIDGSNGFLEVFDVASGTFYATVPVGVRPFDVVASPDNAFFYAIDHDSFTITVVERVTLTVTTLAAAPLGYGEFDKPHYAAVRSDGTLLLPYGGRLLWILDPNSGNSFALTLTSNTHQHGITLSDDESTAYIVGTGPAGPAEGLPSLTVLDLATGEERIIVLSRPHEQVAISSDGTTAILTGGYTFANGGWDGVTLIDLATEAILEIEVPVRPLAIQRLP